MRISSNLSRRGLLFSGRNLHGGSSKAITKTRSKENRHDEELYVPSFRSWSTRTHTRKSGEIPLGLPDANGETFPPRCDMEAKLDELEKERENLIEMCPKDKRDGYQDGSEETLIRAILRYLPAEYDAAVKPFGTCRA